MDDSSGRGKRWMETDAAIARRVCRKCASTRAAVLLEFAILFPIVLSFTLFLMEMCYRWDATVMANHAAFTVARIAKVRVSDRQVTYPELAGVRVDRIAAAMLMMSVTHSWYTGDVGGGWTLPDFDFSSLTSLSALFSAFNGSIDTICPGAGSEGSGKWDVFDGIGTSFASIVQSALKQLAGELCGSVMSSFVDLDSLLGDTSVDYVSRYGMAMQRLLMSDGLKTEVVASERILRHPSSAQSYWKKTAFVKVEINYPLRKYWLFSLMLGPSKSPVMAGGRAAALAEPEKENLDSYFVGGNGGHESQDNSSQNSIDWSSWLPGDDDDDDDDDDDGGDGGDSSGGIDIDPKQLENFDFKDTVKSLMKQTLDKLVESNSTDDNVLTMISKLKKAMDMYNQAQSLIQHMKDSLAKPCEKKD